MMLRNPPKAGDIVPTSVECLRWTIFFFGNPTFEHKCLASTGTKKTKRYRLVCTMTRVARSHGDGNGTKLRVTKKKSFVDFG